LATSLTGQIRLSDLAQPVDEAPVETETASGVGT